VARISGIAMRHARWGDLTEAKTAAGAAELREVAGDRGDLLAQVGGLALGTAEGNGAEYEARWQPWRYWVMTEMIVAGEVLPCWCARILTRPYW
jgi:hypothetical protein